MDQMKCCQRNLLKYLIKPPTNKNYYNKKSLPKIKILEYELNSTVLWGHINQVKLIINW